MCWYPPSLPLFFHLRQYPHWRQPIKIHSGRSFCENIVLVPRGKDLEVGRERRGGVLGKRVTMREFSVWRIIWNMHAKTWLFFAFKTNRPKNVCSVENDIDFPYLQGKAHSRKNSLCPCRAIWDCRRTGMQSRHSSYYSFSSQGVEKDRLVCERKKNFLPFSTNPLLYFFPTAVSHTLTHTHTHTH